MADKIKIGVALLLIAAGIAGFYYLQDSTASLATLMRVGSVLVGLLLAAGVFWTTVSGKQFFAFSKESVNEAKRVVWPTKKEAVQTTAVVVVFAVTMALFLWAVDASLMMVVDKLMGRGD